MTWKGLMWPQHDKFPTKTDYKWWPYISLQILEGDVTFLLMLKIWSTNNSNKKFTTSNVENRCTIGYGSKKHYLLWKNFDIYHIHSFNSCVWSYGVLLRSCFLFFLHSKMRKVRLYVYYFTAAQLDYWPPSRSWEDFHKSILFLSLPWCFLFFDARCPFSFMVWVPFLNFSILEMQMFFWDLRFCLQIFQFHLTILWVFFILNFSMSHQ